MWNISCSKVGETLSTVSPLPNYLHTIYILSHTTRFAQICFFVWCSCHIRHDCDIRKQQCRLKYLEFKIQTFRTLLISFHYPARGHRMSYRPLIVLIDYLIFGRKFFRDYAFANHCSERCNSAWREEVENFLLLV